MEENLGLVLQCDPRNLGLLGAQGQNHLLAGTSSIGGMRPKL